MSSHNSNYYDKKLQKYFDEHFGNLSEDNVEWYVNPADNKWMFDIVKQKKRVILTCDENGSVTRRVLDAKY